MSSPSTEKPFPEVVPILHRVFVWIGYLVLIAIGLAVGAVIAVVVAFFSGLIPLC